MLRVAVGVACTRLTLKSIYEAHDSKWKKRQVGPPGVCIEPLGVSVLSACHDVPHTPSVA